MSFFQSYFEIQKRTDDLLAQLIDLEPNFADYFSNINQREDSNEGSNASVFDFGNQKEETVKPRQMPMSSTPKKPQAVFHIEESPNDDEMEIEPKQKQIQKKIAEENKIEKNAKLVEDIGKNSKILEARTPIKKVDAKSITPSPRIQLVSLSKDSKQCQFCKIVRYQHLRYNN